MYKLKIKQNEVEKDLEFDTAELAQLYRDYHLTFGHWNGLSRWVKEENITSEQRSFIVDEKTEIINGEIVRFYKLTEGIQLVIEEADINSIDQVWKLFREKRNLMLKHTDWTQLADAPISSELKKEYRSYRDYLRNSTKLYDDFTIISAKIRTFEQWKSGLL